MFTVISGLNLNAQSVSDSAVVKKRTESSKDLNNKSNLHKQNNNQKKDGPAAIKRVKGARPDMSKARGARPPDVVRQSGSGIPRGMGKPGGVGKPGGR